MYPRLGILVEYDYYKATTWLPCQNSASRMTWNYLCWYWVECTWCGICCSGSPSSNASKSIRRLYTARHMQRAVM